MSTKLEVGDLVVTRQYDKSERVEICQYKGATGALMYTMTTCTTYELERFIKTTESLPYCSRIIRKDSEQYSNYIK
ncbi:hypothetical protein [Erwinia phage Virsaitis27]|nr:hypothetical protein [Erwinia phage Virsaitis27]